MFQHSPPIHYSSLSYGQPFGTLCGLPPFQHFQSQTSYPHIPSIYTAGHYSGNMNSRYLFCEFKNIDLNQFTFLLAYEFLLGNDSFSDAFDILCCKIIRLVS